MLDPTHFLPIFAQPYLMLYSKDQFETQGHLMVTLTMAVNCYQNVKSEYLLDVFFLLFKVTTTSNAVNNIFAGFVVILIRFHSKLIFGQTKQI